MAVALDDRRCAARFEAALVSRLRATLRPGNVVVLQNLGSGGALVHSTRPLRPGARIHIQIAFATAVIRTGARVLRCGVAALSADGTVYLGALEFDSLCDLPWPEGEG